MKCQIILLSMLGLHRRLINGNECTDLPCFQNVTCERISSAITCVCPCGYLGDGINCTRKVENDGDILLQTKCAIIKDNMVTTLPYVGKEYSIKFELLTTSYKKGWTNVILIGSQDSKITAIYFYRAILNVLHVCSVVNGRNNCVNTRDYGLKTNQWSTVRIDQTEYRNYYKYMFQLNGKLVYTIINSAAKDFYNVNVYVGDPFHEPLSGFIASLSFETKSRKTNSQSEDDAEVRDAKSYVAAVIAGLVMFVTFFFMIRVYFRTKDNTRRVPQRTSTTPMENNTTTTQDGSSSDTVSNNIPSQNSGENQMTDELDPPPSYESFYPRTLGSLNMENMQEHTDDCPPPPSYYSVYPDNSVTPTSSHAVDNPAFTID